MKKTAIAVLFLFLASMPVLASNPFVALGDKYKDMLENISYDITSEMDINGQKMKTVSKISIKDKDNMRIETTMEGNPMGDTTMVITKDKTYTYMKANNMLMEAPKPPMPEATQAGAEGPKPAETEEDGMIKITFENQGMISTMWMDKETRFPLKSEVSKDGKIVSTQTFSNVRKGDPGDLMTFPKDAQKMAMPGTGASAAGDDCGSCGSAEGCGSCGSGAACGSCEKATTAAPAADDEDDDQ